MTTLITRVSDTDGVTYELGRLDSRGLATAYRRAARLARLLGLIGDPDRWAGGRVSVLHHAGDPQPRLVYAWRIRVPQRVAADVR